MYGDEIVALVGILAITCIILVSMYFKHKEKMEQIRGGKFSDLRRSKDKVDTIDMTTEEYHQN